MRLTLHRAAASMTGMSARAPACAALLAAAGGLIGCLQRGPEKPSREAVVSLLQTEAQAMKKDGEQIDPVLGVKSTWTVEGVDVQEQPGDRARPWRGSIRFRIENRMRDADGTITNDRVDKKFDYLYDAAGTRWLIQYSPSPAKRR